MPTDESAVEPDHQVTRTVTTPTDELRDTLAAVASLDPHASELVAARVEDGRLVVELEGERV